MKSRFFCVLAGVILGVSATSARADFVTYDDFNTGSVPDANLWYEHTADVPDVSNGSVNWNGVAYTTAGWAGIRSKQSFGYGSFRFTLSSFTEGSAHVLGINSQPNFGSPAAADALMLSDAQGSAAVYKGGVAYDAVSGGWAPSGTPVTYTFVYHPDEMAVYRGSDRLLQVTDPAKIASGKMYFEIGAYSETGAGAFSVDSVSYEAVPEPATGILVTLGAGALLAYAWSKRK